MPNARPRFDRKQVSAEVWNDTGYNNMLQDHKRNVWNLPDPVKRVYRNMPCSRANIAFALAFTNKTLLSYV